MKKFGKLLRYLGFYRTVLFVCCGISTLLLLCVYISGDYEFVETLFRFDGFPSQKDRREIELAESGFLNASDKDFIDDDIDLNLSDLNAMIDRSSYGRCLSRKVRQINLKLPKRRLPKRCADDVTIVFLIKSSIYRNALRQIIRVTWGREVNKSVLTNYKTRRLFLVGSFGNNRDRSPLIDAEARQNGDILQGAFKDTYKSVTSKVILGMKFVKKFCGNTQYVVVIDDDAVLFPWNLQAFLNSHSSSPDTSDLFYAGYFWQNAKISRNLWDKYRILRDEYSCSEFLPYPSGAAYVMNIRTMVEFCRLSTQFRTFFLDDAYFGALAAILKAPLTRLDRNQLSLDCKSQMQPHSLDDGVVQLIVCHGVDFAVDHKNIWLESCFSHSSRGDSERVLLLFYCSDLTKVQW